VRRAGFFFLNPFYSKSRISLRVHNFNTPTMKVNDAAGNPVDVAAVVTWRVADTAQALFDVENYTDYIHIQSEMSLRDVVSQYAYDGDAKVTLRGNVEAVAARLAEVLQAHLELAGIQVIEARITHLAYAAEIAGAMLRRQQAEAIVSAREKLVEGAVGMVQLALEQLSSRSIATLDARERAHLVTSMMTVLISDSGVQPTVSVASTGHGA
jgi:regulator of protease activity HflC (stomatin/prohibitin superfamily)